ARGGSSCRLVARRRGRSSVASCGCARPRGGSVHGIIPIPPLSPRSGVPRAPMPPALRERLCTDAEFRPGKRMDLIDGVKVRPLKPIHDERGYLMEMLRSDWPEFTRFGQVYVTIGYPGIVKGWHFHKVQTDNFIVVRGQAKVVCYDNRDGSKTKGKVNEFFP